jgi:hypothetical protein
MYWLDPLQVAQFLVCAFFCVLFLQSGLDKVFDNKGNLEWMTPHFANSPFRNMVPVMLAIITVIELSAGAMSGVGAAMLLFGKVTWAVVGVGLSALALLFLFAGQRIAKDYAGAVTLATYFGVAMIGLFLLSQ